jgi:hypothetical protein
MKKMDICPISSYDNAGNYVQIITEELIIMARGKSYHHKRKDNENKPKVAQVNNKREKDSKE